MGERGFTKPCKNYCKQLIVFFLNFLNSFVHDCSYNKIFQIQIKVENIVFADIFVFLRTKKTTVLPYNRLCFQVQVLGTLNQF